MKKIALLVIILAFTLVTYAQKVIEEPLTGFTTVEYLHLKMLEINDTATILSFHITYPKGQWISVPKSTYIQPIDGDKHYVTSTIGIPLAKQYLMPESGEVDFQLVFPKLDDQVTVFDYGEETNSGTWKIFDIQLKEADEIYPFPQQLAGNWFNNTDGSWLCSFMAGKGVYNQQVWDYKAYEGSKKKGKLTLVNESGQTTLIVKQGKSGTYSIGASKDEMIVCTSERNNINNASQAEYSLPVFNMDSATYSGYLKGYNKRIGQTTGAIHVNNLLTGKQESYVVKFTDEGYFSVSVPFYYPHRVWVRFPGFNGSVFLEPGKELFHLISMGNQKPQFMGEPAAINYELIELDKIRLFDYNKMQKMILDMDLKAYKTYCFNLMQQEQNKLDSLMATDKVSKKAYQLKKFDIQYRYMNQSMEYRWTYEGAYRKKHNIPYKQRELDIEVEQPDLAYYDFLTPEVINNPLAVISTDYDTFFNRLKFLPILRGENIGFAHEDLITEMADNGYEFTDDEREIIAKLKELKKLKDSPEEKAFEKYDKLASEFFSKHLEKVQSFIKENNNELDYNKFLTYLEKAGVECTPEIRELFKAMEERQETIYAKQNTEFRKENQEVLSKMLNSRSTEINQFFNWKIGQLRNKALKEKFGIDEGFATDVMMSQDLCRKIVEEYTPVSEKELQNQKKQFTSSFIAQHLEQMNNNTLVKIEANKNKSGYVLNEVPKTEGAQLFSTIMEKYKGKVILVDFWATWCSPCRSAIQRITPLKEELADKDVVFVYITNHTSPEGAYNNMIADIKGEHYRVSPDEWNFFKQEFQITGIPHYTLVGKKGEILNPHLSHGMSNEQLKGLFLKHLE